MFFGECIDDDIKYVLKSKWHFWIIITSYKIPKYCVSDRLNYTIKTKCKQKWINISLKLFKQLFFMHCNKYWFPGFCFALIIPYYISIITKFRIVYMLCLSFRIFFFLMFTGHVLCILCIPLNTCYEWKILPKLLLLIGLILWSQRHFYYIGEDLNWKAFNEMLVNWRYC